MVHIWSTRNCWQDVTEEDVLVVACPPRRFRIQQKNVPIRVEHPEGRYFVIRLSVAPRAEY
eukprot:1436145-Pyramimonas_sp.AAC.1